MVVLTDDVVVGATLVVVINCTVVVVLDTIGSHVSVVSLQIAPSEQGFPE